jgi:hypothetical protein
MKHSYLPGFRWIVCLLVVLGLGSCEKFEFSTHEVLLRGGDRNLNLVNAAKIYLLEPLKMGTGISYSIGPQFHTTWPGRYPEGYYWWTTSFRFTPFIGPTLSRKVGNEHTLIKRVQLYSELGTNDLALVSYIGNKKLAFTEIWNIALGTRLVF